jgi:hypothetical protein
VRCRENIRGHAICHRKGNETTRPIASEKNQ